VQTSGSLCLECRTGIRGGDGAAAALDGEDDDDDQGKPGERCTAAAEGPEELVSLLSLADVPVSEA
jgi:hypothetical protein